jgi:hypothetical protein
MVNADGQLYTIEGVAAALIILLTAYIVVNSTSVYTPGDTHISNMQLEVVGSDALTMMNTAANSTIGKSPLQTMVENNDAAGFMTMFNNTVNNRTGLTPEIHPIQFLADVAYVNNSVTNTINSTFLSSSSRSFTGSEHAVHVSQWVVIEKNQFTDCTASDCKNRKHAVLVEVLLWRD